MTREVEIRGRIALLLETPVEEIAWQAPLDSLAVGSLQFVEVVVDLQELFVVQLFHRDMDRIACLDDLVHIIDGRLRPGSAVGRVAETASESAAGPPSL
jgi:acyl carrier protein